MMDSFSLKNKKILITGASSGIGMATAIACAQKGAKLIISGRKKDKLEKLKSTLINSEIHTIIIADLLKKNDVKNLTKACEHLDGLVHSAGVVHSVLFKHTTEKLLKYIFEVNYNAPILLTQQLIEIKSITKNCSIVFVSSIGGTTTAVPGISVYAGTKGALNSTVKVMAVELALKKIRVNSICPGMVKSAMIDEQFTSISKEQFNEYEKKYPLGFGEPEDVANGVVFLLSDASKWITGTNLIMDGGASIS